MERLFGEFLELAIPGAILLGVLYGIFLLIRRGYRKLIRELANDKSVENDNGKLSYEQKKNILDMVKILVGAQMIGLLFYVTPAINENIKIFASLVITLGSFISTFFIKEKKGYNGVCRGLIFIGQEFFGITMFLMMVNKGMGYSVNTIFLIWTAFNFYISKQFNKIENRIFFWLTLFILICSMISTYGNNVDSYMLVMGICVILLAIHLFTDKTRLSTRIAYNVFLTMLVIVVFLAVVNLADSQTIIFGTVLIYMLVILGTLIAVKNLNIKVFLIYVPYIAALCLMEFETELLYLLTVFNTLAAIWMVADKSIYKKILCGITLLFTVPMVVGGLNVDELIGFIIYGSSVIFTFTYLFAPIRQDSLEEGGEDDE